MKEKPAIEIKNLTNQFGSQLIHDNLALTINTGEILGVVGASGSGKSVLMRTILGLNQPKKGEIRVFGHSVEDSVILQHHTGVMFQKGALFSSLTVLENVMFPLLELASLAFNEAKELALLRLRMVGLTEESAFKMPADLSGGMVKRVALARALALDAKLLFLDEPTSGLDPLSAEELDYLILTLSKQLRLTVFMITHDLGSLFSICDRIAVLIHHQALTGTLKELLSHKDPWIHSYFHGSRAPLALKKE